MSLRVPTEVCVQAPSDLDVDGRADLLWRHRTGGFNAIWLMDGLTVLPSSTALLRLTDQNWTIVGIAKQPVTD